MNETAFHHAILGAPDDDAPRLIYADWLDEQGQPARAEFIRVQCMLARLHEDDPRHADLKAREEGLLQEHEEAWIAPLREMLNGWVFHRGMMGVGVDVSQFLAHGDILVRSPLIHCIDIADHAVGRECMEALAASPLLNRVTLLDLAGWYCYDNPADLVDDEQTVWLANSPYTSRLTVLNLRCNQIRDAGVEALARSTHLSRLEQLDLRANLFGDDGLLALASSPRLGEWKFLDLSYDDGRGRTEVGWRGLAAAPALDRLGALSLAGNDISEETRAALKARLGERVGL